MIQENQILPYETFPLPSGPWLVLAPHPDDETFGMGGSLLRAKEEGIRTEVLIMTDGALGGDSPGLVRRREDEARAAARFLGVSALHFLGEPDRALRCTDELAGRLAGMIAQSKPATVFFPGVLEPHPDHRATAWLAWRALALLDDRAITPAAYEISVQSPANHLIDITAQMPAKRQAMSLYVSQLAENNYQDIVTALNTARTYTLPPAVSHAEAFRFHDPSAPASENSLADLSLAEIARLFEK